MPKLLHRTVEKNKLKIERAALQLFTRKGFHGTTVREIAKKAGVSMGKLYIYYDTKEDIFIDLVHHLGRKMEAIRQKELIPLMASLDPDSLRNLARAIGRVVSENLDYWRLMYIDVVEFRHKHFIHSFREIAGGLRMYANAMIRDQRSHSHPEWTPPLPTPPFTCNFLLTSLRRNFLERSGTWV